MITLAIVIVVASAGCIGPVDNILNDGSSESGSGNTVDAIPQQADVVMLIDPIGFLEDPTTREMGNYFIQDVAEQDGEYDSRLDSFFDQFNDNLSESLNGTEIEIATEDIGDIAVFADTDQVQEGTPTLDQASQNVSDQYAGVVFELDISEDDLEELSQLAENQSTENQDLVETSQYKDRTLFTVSDSGESLSLALLDEGLHVAGPTDVVEDAVDTYAGDSEGVDESIIPERESNTYLSLGTGDLNQTYDGLAEQVDGVEEDPKINSVLLTYSTNADDTIELSADLTSDDGDALFNTQAELENQLSDLRAQVRNNSSAIPEFTEPVLGEENLDVSYQQSTLSFTYQATTQELQDFFDGLYEADLGTGFVPGLGGDEPQVTFPQITTEYETNDLDTGYEINMTVVQNENVQTLRFENSEGEQVASFSELEEGEQLNVTVPEETTSVNVYGVTSDGNEGLVNSVFLGF